jgi:L,D-peptidoglycan transpeptidase YkuD (ErfK/YbiS/YcfS/YnhG family)
VPVGHPECVRIDTGQDRVEEVSLFRKVLTLTFCVSALRTRFPDPAKAATDWSLPEQSRQLIVGVAPIWDSSTVTLRRYERRGATWRQIGTPFAGRVGVHGLVWGRGLNPRSDDMTDKSEGDGRAPAGVFTLGQAFGYDEAWKAKTKLPYVTVGTRDLLVEDANSPLYNTYVRLDHEPATAFEKKQQMKQNDAMHRLKILINHNTEPSIVPGKGSAILFHIWRADGTKPTAGCTSVSDASIETLMKWLDPAKQPIYALLPAVEYDHRQATWGLPKL